MSFTVGERVRVNVTRHQHHRAFQNGDTGRVVQIVSEGYRGDYYCMVKLDQDRVIPGDTNPLKDIWSYNLESLCPRKRET